MHLLLPALIRLFRVDASVDIRRASIKTLTKLIPRVQVGRLDIIALQAGGKLTVICMSHVFNCFPYAFFFVCFFIRSLATYQLLCIT